MCQSHTDTWSKSVASSFSDIYVMHGDNRFTHEPGFVMKPRSVWVWFTGSEWAETSVQVHQHHPHPTSTSSGQCSGSSLFSHWCYSAVFKCSLCVLAQCAGTNSTFVLWHECLESLTDPSSVSLLPQSLCWKENIINVHQWPTFLPGLYFTTCCCCFCCCCWPTVVYYPDYSLS